jgi:hypothetical protein
VLTQACTEYRSRQNSVPSQHASRGWSCCYRVWRAPARAGTAATPLQWQGWQSTGLEPPPNPVGSQESESRVKPAPFRGLGASTVLGQAHGVTGLTPAALHSSFPQWRGWAPPWGVGAAAPGCEPRAHDGAISKGAALVGRRGPCGVGRVLHA